MSLPSRRTIVTVISGLALALVAAACVPIPPPPPPPQGPFPADIGLPANSPTLAVNTAFVTQTTGPTSIANPWDIAFVDSTRALFTERQGRISLFDSTAASGTPAKLVGTTANTLANGESGLMGIAIDPQFATNSFIYVCISSSATGSNEIRRYTVDLSAAAGAGLSGETLLLQGMPVANFHDGCRIRFQPGTNPPALYITMGDAGIGPGPQDLTSLAGKILRVEVDTGVLQPYPGNPFIGSANPNTKLIYTYGHRNPQGIAFRPGSNAPYNAEHGPNINDEVNRLAAGGNAGWNPNTGGGYDQSHPMTDFGLGGNVFGAVWRSGDSFTLAPSGATFLAGVQWKAWNGALAVAFLKDSKLRIMFLDGAGNVTGSYPTLGGKRLRSAVEGPDGNLYISTDAGAGNDAIYKVVPS